MTALPDPLLLAYITAGLIAAFILNEARHAAITQWRDRHRPPVPENAVPPRGSGAASPPLRQPPAPGPHGGHVAAVNIWADGYTETAYTISGHTEIHRGECTECAQGTCTWCGTYPVYDRALRREVYRYQKCPAHQNRERQP